MLGGELGLLSSGCGRLGGRAALVGLAEFVDRGFVELPGRAAVLAALLFVHLSAFSITISAQGLRRIWDRRRAD